MVMASKSLLQPIDYPDVLDRISLDAGSTDPYNLGKIFCINVSGVVQHPNNQ